MKKSQRFKQLDSSYVVNNKGLVLFKDSSIGLEKDEVIEIYRDADGKSN